MLIYNVSVKLDSILLVEFVLLVKMVNILILLLEFAVFPAKLMKSMTSILKDVIAPKVLSELMENAPLVQEIPPTAQSVKNVSALMAIEIKVITVWLVVESMKFFLMANAAVKLVIILYKVSAHNANGIKSMIKV